MPNLSIRKIKTLSLTLFKTGFFHIFGSGSLAQIVTFLSNIILVQLVSKESYGVYSYALNIYSIALLASGLGSTSAMLQLASEKFGNLKEQTEVYQYALKFGLIANSGFVFLIVLIAVMCPFEIEGVQLLLFMYSLLPIFQYLNEYQAVYLRSERNNQGYSFLNLLNSILILIFSVIGASLFGVQGFIVAQYLAAMIVVFISVKRYKTPIKLVDCTLPKADRKLFAKFALIISVGNAFYQIKAMASAVVLGLVIPDAEIMASNNVAMKIPVALLFIPSAVCVYLYPYFAEHINDPKWCLKYFKISLGGLLSINILVAIFAFVFAEPIISVCFGEEYLDSLSVFYIYIIYFVVAGSLNSLPGNLLGAQRKFALNLIVNILTGVLSILLCVILATEYGSEGAAIAVLLGSFISGIVYVGLLLRTYEKKIQEQKKKISTM